MYQQFSRSAAIIFGCGAISVLGEKVKELGCKKAMCVIDKGIEGTNIPGKAIKSLKDAGIDVVIFSGVVADPPVDVVDEGGALAKKEGVDCLIGVGGGSSMDTAKAISILLSNPGTARDYILPKPNLLRHENACHPRPDDSPGPAARSRRSALSRVPS